VRAAGIDVYSTVNVQHLESLNDQVAELTGVRVRETVPDEELAKADEVVLIDLPPEDLVTRLKDGKVYDAARVPAALNGFFRVENLRALREVALRQVAELTGVRVRETVPDEELEKADEVVLIDLPPEDLVARLRDGKVYDAARVPAALNGFFRVEHLKALREVALRQVAETVEATRPDAQPIAERLLAFVTLDEAGERVVRRAARSAARLNAVLDVLVVRDPETAASADERARLETLRRLAAMVGAHLLVDDGSDEIAVLQRVARERGTTYLLVGPPAPRRGLGRFAEPQIVRILRALPQVDVRVVADRG